MLYLQVCGVVRSFVTRKGLTLEIRFEPDRRDGRRTKVVWAKDGSDNLRGPCFNRNFPSEALAHKFAQLVEAHGGFPPYHVLNIEGLTEHGPEISPNLVLRIRDLVMVDDVDPGLIVRRIRSYLRDF